VNASHQSLDDTQWLRRIARRDREALALFYDRYSGMLYSTLLLALNNREEAAGALQEVFIQIWDQAGAYDPAMGKPFTWALTLARRRASDRLRRHPQRSHLGSASTSTWIWSDQSSPSPTLSPNPSVSSDVTKVFGHEQVTLIRIALEELPAEQRQAIEMAFAGGLGQNELADALGQPVSIIKARIRRGMLTLRERLKRIL
jgi:RNA polymerase sigma-70 factor (ECF subfamily)